MSNDETDPGPSQSDGFDLDKFRHQAIAVYSLLNQDQIWVDVHGRVHSIGAMSVRYKANCLAFMRARVRYFADRYVWGEIESLSLPSGFSIVNAGGVPERQVTMREFMLDDGGNLSHAFDEHLDAVQAAIKTDPERWLDSTPLMKALSDQVLAGEGGAVGERLQDAPRECPPGERCGKCGKPAHIRAVHRRNAAGLVRLCTGEWVRFRTGMRT